MLVWILKRMGYHESRIRETVEKYTHAKMLVSTFFYTVMVFIVIFGISGDVYAGFPKFVPYIIIAVFLFMAFVRMYQCMVDDSYIKLVAAKMLEDKDKNQKKSNPFIEFFKPGKPAGDADEATEKEEN